MSYFLIGHFLYAWMAWSPCCGAEAVSSSQRGMVTFESEQVAFLYKHYDIGSATPVDSLQATRSVRTLLYSAPADVPGLLVVQVKDRMHIQHVGLHLFTSEESAAFEPVSRFLERYLLNVYAQSQSPEMALSLLQSRQISIQINGYTLGTAADVTNDVRVLTQYFLNERACSLDWRDFTYILTCQTEQSDHLEIQIPAHAELILGLDKKELQKALDSVIVQYDAPVNRPVICEAPVSSSLISHRGRIVRSQGRVLHPGIRSEIYYVKARRGSSPQLLQDPADWLEYLNNIIMCPAPDLPARVRVNHKVYGPSASTFEIPVSTLLAYFEPGTFDTYVGFERTDANSITGTVVFKHTTFDYNHLLVIEELDRLVSGTKDAGVLNAGLYTFIRNDNVASLFGAYVDRKGEKIPVVIDPE